ncbi:MAG TPA: 50S ribosomal protein L18 [Thermoplasmata archaeon]|nr:50S ribosomal protein L18 [Thermoplasmata archaeon]
MSDSPRYRVPFRRRRSGKTDFRVRLRLLKGDRPRAVVRITRHRVLVAIASFDPVGDRIVASAESPELTRHGFPKAGLASTPAAYLTGYLAGLRAKARGTSAAILDTGLRHPTRGGRLLGALKGLIDAGVEIPRGAETGLPTADRLNGKHMKHPLPEPLEMYRTRLTAEPKGASA